MKTVSKQLLRVPKRVTITVNEKELKRLAIERGWKTDGDQNEFWNSFLSVLESEACVKADIKMEWK